MAASNLEEMAKIFNQFGDSDQFGSGLADNPEVIAKQSGIYREAAIFRVDIPRGLLRLMIGETEVLVDGAMFRRFEGNITSAQDAFQVVWDRLQAPEEEGGAGLDEANAFYVLKQIALAYRGQNGTVDGHHLIGVPLMSVLGLLLKFNGIEISMRFEDLDGRFVLVEKTEYSPILGTQNTRANGRFITSEVRFKFPDDLEVRTQLPITSTRILSADGEIIKWRCPFRENPPRKVILYGGCMPVDTH
jgi:hypothetical protein